MSTRSEGSDETVARDSSPSDPGLAGANAVSLGERRPSERPRASSGVDPRMLAAWREWLGALATDAEAALAASHVYGELTPEAREAWLEALREDVPKLSIPSIAVYAPLLVVENDPDRRARIEDAMSESFDPFAERPLARALRGIATDGARVVALVLPQYLAFVRVLFCRYVTDVGFVWAQHDAILGEKDAPVDGARLDGVMLEATPLKLVVEELALAILATRRRGGELPPSLLPFADMFDASADADPLP